MPTGRAPAEGTASTMDNPKNLPLYQAIFDHYRKRIESGMLLPGDPLPSEAQMAQLYGVSNITARRALNELKRQGLAVRERGRGSFVANPSAGKPSSEQMDRVMLIFPKDSHYTKAAEFIATLYTLLERRGYYLGVHFSDDSEAREGELLRQALAEQVKGILLYPVSSLGNVPALLLIREMRLPLVLIDRAHLVQGFPVAVSDNVSGGRMLADYLLSRGYEQILFVTNRPLSSATSLRDRYHGYVMALLHSGRSVRDTSPAPAEERGADGHPGAPEPAGLSAQRAAPGRPDVRDGSDRRVPPSLFAGKRPARAGGRGGDGV